MRKLSFVLLLVLFPTLAAHGQAPKSDVHWELVRPFRFFTDPQLFDELRNVYGGLENSNDPHNPYPKNAYGLENKLQSLANSDALKIRDDAKAAGKCVEGSMSVENRRLCYSPYYGWAGPI